jgi:hypothetical protein
MASTSLATLSIRLVPSISWSRSISA